MAEPLHNDPGTPAVEVVSEPSADAPRRLRAIRELLLRAAGRRAVDRDVAAGERDEAVRPLTDKAQRKSS